MYFHQLFGYVQIQFMQERQDICFIPSYLSIFRTELVALATPNNGQWYVFFSVLLQTHGFLYILCVSIHFIIILFDVQIVPSWARGRPLSWLLYPFDMTPLVFDITHTHTRVHKKTQHTTEHSTQNHATHNTMEHKTQ